MPKQTRSPTRRHHALLQQQVVLETFCTFFSPAGQEQYLVASRAAFLHYHSLRATFEGSRREVGEGLIHAKKHT